MPVDDIYSTQLPLGATRDLWAHIRVHGLESFENGVLNSLNLGLLGFGRVTLDAAFQSDDRQSFYNEINVVLGGRGFLRFDGREVEMKAGQVYLFPAGADRLAHRNASLQKIYFQFRALVNGCELLHRTGPLSAPLPPALGRVLAERLRPGKPPGLLDIRAQALACLALFSDPLGGMIRGRREHLRSFEPFFNYVAQRLNGEFSLADFGARQGLRAKTFAAQFKKAFGESPKKYFLREKLNRLKEALYYSDRPLGEISEAFGFSDQYYFSRFFKKESGMNPTEFRHSVASVGRK
ncbi:MAG: helix-turn-helix domain-containing protein [Spirochaetes bacterium]|nr:helix-turn-helix domain-containing protein [Spirochaetota bacterium]